ncbi:glutathione S-transferase family protein [Martelella soudanensis]|uniref:glutathione S-transferase family protein n=1 Tax=unclassified Martelella TaxID=2629616 RepID=UPI0015DE258A|nr:MULTISPECIES: glutathione S-transferase family protein [unclassified Martelella]
MKLFHAPGACSEGIVLLLDRIGEPYDIHEINVKTGEQRQPDYLAINPKGKVPALLRDDGSLLTEFPAIAFWLARKFPEAGLLPTDPDGEARALELLDFIVSSLHMRGTALVQRPTAFAHSAEAQEEVKAMGRQAIEKGLAQLERELDGQKFLMGERFSLPDAAAYYVLSWQPRYQVPLGEQLEAYYARLSDRSAA